MHQFVQIALDGPSGAGKSTLARAMAAKLGYLYLDTGAMYRAAACKALQLGLDVNDAAALQVLPACTQIVLRPTPAGTQVLLDNRDVSAQIREHAVSAAASAISRHAQIRAWLVQLQQQLAGQQNVIMDGRDIGTRVLPHAQYKFFLTADVQVRAHRRYLELRARGEQVAEAQVVADMCARDLQDSTRAVDPLRPAPDAVTVDTTAMNEEEVLAYLLAAVSA